jgi:hypothetical protein
MILRNTAMSSYTEKPKAGHSNPQQLDNATFTCRKMATSQLPNSPRSPNKRTVPQPVLDIILEAVSMAIEQAFANAVKGLIGGIIEQAMIPLSARIAPLLTELERHGNSDRCRQLHEGPQTKQGPTSNQ